jgi:hypothetical protein
MKTKPVKGVRNQQGFCLVRDDLGVQCEREPLHKGKHAYDLITGSEHRWAGGFIPSAEYTALQARTGLVVTDLLRIVRSTMPTHFATDPKVHRGQKLLEMVG